MALTNPRFRTPRSAYIHVPFCRHRCRYCNFTLVAGRDDLTSAYLEALALELQRLETPRPIDTLFLGGGTPTHLTPAQLSELLALVRHWFPLTEGFEFSVEANPSDLSPARADVLREFGVNRLSLGCQSFSAAKLEFLERDHTAAGVRSAFEVAQQVSHNVSLDLIFGVPGETEETWERDLAEARALQPSHVSTYGLTVERGTRLWAEFHHGRYTRLGETAELRLYRRAIDRLAEWDRQQYEVSNFAAPGYACRHNLTYWEGHTYYAAGPGAARHVDGRRETNHRSTTTYLKRLLAHQSPVAESEYLSPQASAQERLAFGLRVREGVELDRFARETGFTVHSLVAPFLTCWQDQELIEIDAGRIRLTETGVNVADSIAEQILNEI